MTLLTIQECKEILNRDFHVSRETLGKIDHYISILLLWNKKIALVSKEYSCPKKIWYHHILDSVQLITYIKTGCSVVDVGSGNGLPGVILALLGVEQITLVESSQKKAAFLRYISAELSLENLHIVNDRIESVQLMCDFLTAKAFSSIEKLLILTENIRVNHSLLLLKGKSTPLQFRSLERKYNVICKVFESDIYENNYVVKINRN